MNEKIHVLDSTAFFAGIPFQGEGKYYTTYQVLDEVRGRGIGAQLIHSRVQVTEPSKESVLKVKEASNKTGDSKSLSEADTSILAVSLDLIKSRRDQDVVLVTDDFAVRNVAEVMGVNLSETSIRGEWKKITWVTYCKGCGKEYLEPRGSVCEVCGTKLSRKPRANN
ncbi:MAG: PIN domain-containing protein [Thaumarchaeota archaeon]|nr:PIN domain-containing protein [Nitrososphaerota archaeon]